MTIIFSGRQKHTKCHSAKEEARCYFYYWLCAFIFISLFLDAMGNTAKHSFITPVSRWHTKTETTPFFSVCVYKKTVSVLTHHQTVLLWSLKSNTCTGSVIEIRFSLMWGQSVILCFIWSRSLTYLPPWSPSVLSHDYPLSTPFCSFCQSEIKHHSGSVSCLLKSFVMLLFTRSSRCMSVWGGGEQVWWVTRYVLWGFAFVSTTTAGAPFFRAMRTFDDWQSWCSAPLTWHLRTPVFRI